MTDFEDRHSAAIKASDHGLKLFDRATQNALPLSILSGKIDSPAIALGAGESHKLCLIKRPRIDEVSRQEFEVFPMSRYVIKRLLLAANPHEEKEMVALFHHLSDQAGGKEMSPYVFESYIHQQYCEHIKIDARRMTKRRSFSP